MSKPTGLFIRPHAWLAQVFRAFMPPLVKDHQSLLEMDVCRSLRVNAYVCPLPLRMKATAAHHERIAQLTLASVYPHYVQKIAKKGRTEEELLRTIEWLTGYDARAVEQAIANRLTFQAFFQSATLNPKAHEIKGLICGYRIEEIDVELTRHVRYLDKLVDDLAKGKVRY